jgi:hypothetical protein
VINGEFTGVQTVLNGVDGEVADVTPPRSPSPRGSCVRR